MQPDKDVESTKNGKFLGRPQFFGLEGEVLGVNSRGNPRGGNPGASPDLPKKMWMDHGRRNMFSQVERMRSYLLVQRR